MKPRFITFEGIEGVGKSTQIHTAAEFLRGRGVSIKMTREPGGTKTGERIRELLLDPETTIRARTELALIIAARIEHIEEVIKPALAKGHWVLCDRFSDATVAYQGYGRGVPIGDILEMIHSGCGSLVPDLTILLDADPETGHARIQTRGVVDRFEQEKLSFFHKIRKGYLEIARQNKGRIVVVDASRDITLVGEEVIEQLTRIWGEDTEDRR